MACRCFKIILMFLMMVTKIINYLLNTSNKDRFRIIAESIYQSTEAISLQAELLNQSGELINSPDIEITINSDKGFLGNFTFLERVMLIHCL